MKQLKNSDFALEVEEVPSRSFGIRINGIIILINYLETRNNYSHRLNFSSRQ